MIGLDVLRDFNQLLPDQFPAQVLKQQAGFWWILGRQGWQGGLWGRVVPLAMLRMDLEGLWILHSYTIQLIFLTVASEKRGPKSLGGMPSY